MTDDTIYTIPSWNVSKLNDKIAKLNRKAAKIGVAPIEVKLYNERTILDPRFEHDVRCGKITFAQAPKITVYDVEVTGEGPKIEGYTFVGSLDHTIIPGSVIVKTVPGQVVPADYFNAEPVCNHCGKIRRRKDTFVLRRDEDGGHIQVGRSCLKDFFGHDPSQVVRYLTSLYKEMAELSDEHEWFGGGGPRFYEFDKFEILELTIAVIRTWGWVSKGDAMNDDDKFPTSSMVVDLLLPSTTAQQAEIKRKMLAKLIREDTDTNEAKDAVEWLMSLDPNNEYLHNLQNLNKLDSIPTNMFGFWCSLIATYHKHLDRLNRQASVHRVNAWVGEIKKREDFIVKVESITPIDGAFGTVYLFKFLKDTGETIVWFANTRPDMRTGESYKIKATVKKHDEFRDWKQTVVNRAKVLEYIEG